MEMRNPDQKNILSMWTLFDRPLDYPNCFVARRVDIKMGSPLQCQTNEIMRHTRAEVLIEELEAWGFYPLGRQPQDEPQIVGSWI